ncbi:hypothetical protein OHR68_39495 [Spirillospora sp. NBC_00431]
MSALIASIFVLALSGALLFVWSGLVHLAHFNRLRAALSAQAILPFSWQRAAGRMLIGVELSVGVAALASVTLGARPGFVALALAYGGLGAYVAVLMALGKRVPCGCFDSEEAISVHVLLRCLVFAFAAGMVSLADPPPQDAGMAALVLSPAAVVFAVLARALPAIHRREA